jgi:hypothetical protein
VVVERVRLQSGTNVAASKAKGCSVCMRELVGKEDTEGTDDHQKET